MMLPKGDRESEEEGGRRRGGCFLSHICIASEAFSTAPARPRTSVSLGHEYLPAQRTAGLTFEGFVARKEGDRMDIWLPRKNSPSSSSSSSTLTRASPQSGCRSRSRES